MIKKDDPRLKFCYENNPESVDVWVCGDWFPKGSFSKDIAGFPMNRLLKMQLDYLIHNVVDDWDFTLIICGEGEVRIGKCLKKGSKILMSNGEWKNVEDVKINDEVISPQEDGNITYEKVTSLHNRLEQNCYDVIEKSTGNILYSCADNHEIPLYKNNQRKGLFESKVMEAQELAKYSDKCKNKFYCLSSPCLEYKNILEPKINPYVLGVYLGDGSFSSIRKIRNDDKGSTGNWLGRNLNITSNDFEIVEEVSKYYPIMSISNKQKTTAKTYRFSLNGELSKQLSLLGLEGKGSGEKFIPKDCLLSSKEFRFNLLAGLVDTDGYINKNNSIAITTKSKLLAEDIKNLVYSLGGSSSIKNVKKKCQNGFIGDYFSVKISFTDNSIIPLKVKFKIDRLKKSKFNRNHIYVKCIKSSASEVYGFSITGKSKCHITDNWMITHNSTFAQQISTYWTWSLIHLLKIKLPHSVQENVVFVGSDLIKKGNRLGQHHLYSSLIFDEAGADLEGVKSMKQTTQAVRDYLRECGQYNMLNILVLPEFFDLPKGIAISRSIAMINVFWVPDDEGTFNRGYFKFYNKPDKKMLYLKGKRDLDYNAHQETFYGRFPRFFTYDEKEYKKEKLQALKNREQLGTKEKRQMEVLYACFKIFRDKFGLGLMEMKELINKNTFSIKISHVFIFRFIKRMINLLGEKENEWELDINEQDNEYHNEDSED